MSIFKRLLKGRGPDYEEYTIPCPVESGSKTNELKRRDEELEPKILENLRTVRHTIRNIRHNDELQAALEATERLRQIRQRRRGER